MPTARLEASATTPSPAYKELFIQHGKVFKPKSLPPVHNTSPLLTVNHFYENNKFAIRKTDIPVTL